MATRGGVGGGRGGDSDGGHSDDSLLSAEALSYRPSRRGKTQDTMKSLGKHLDQHRRLAEVSQDRCLGP